MEDQILENDMVVRFRDKEYWIAKGTIVRKIGGKSYFLPPEKKSKKKGDEGLSIDVHEDIVTEDHAHG